MFPARFEYFRARDLPHALQLLQMHEGARVLAGGHSLIPVMKLRLAEPPVLIDIGRVESLKETRLEEGKIRIGALTTHARLIASEVLKDHCPILPEAAHLIGDPQVRNRGTVGGNLAHADPGSDLPAVFLALQAVMRLEGPDGPRSVAAADFFQDILTTDVLPGEILTGIEFPIPKKHSGWCYLKFDHPASGYAVCGAAALVEIDAQGSCRDVQLCFNGVSGTPVSARKVSDALRGKTLSDEEVDKAVQEHLEIEEPMGDLYASASYRVELARVYGRRALKKARDRAREARERA